MLEFFYFFLVTSIRRFTHKGTKGRFARVPSPKSQVTWDQSMQSQPMRAWKLGHATSHGVPSPKYPMDAYMATLFGGKAWDLC